MMWVQAVTDSDDVDMVQGFVATHSESIIVGLSVVDAMVILRSIEGVPGLVLGDLRTMLNEAGEMLL